jgi:hypothetical protein
MDYYLFVRPKFKIRGSVTCCKLSSVQRRNKCLHATQMKVNPSHCSLRVQLILTLSLLMSYIYGAPSKARSLTSYIYGRDFLLGDFAS